MTLVKEASVQAAKPQVAGSGRVSTPVLGPIACINCGQRVMWRRVDGFWRLKDEDGAKHRCPKPLCGVLLRRTGEPCARSAGHAGGNGGGHRSRYVMDNDARMRRGKWAAA